METWIFVFLITLAIVVSFIALKKLKRRFWIYKEIYEDGDITKIRFWVNNNEFENYSKAKNYARSLK